MFKPFSLPKYSRHPFYKEQYGDAPDMMKVMSQLCSECGYPFGSHSGLVGKHCPDTEHQQHLQKVRKLNPYPFKK